MGCTFGFLVASASFCTGCLPKDGDSFCRRKRLRISSYLASAERISTIGPPSQNMQGCKVFIIRRSNTSGCPTCWVAVLRYAAGPKEGPRAQRTYGNQLDMDNMFRLAIADLGHSIDSFWETQLQPVAVVRQPGDLVSTTGWRQLETKFVASSRNLSLRSHGGLEPMKVPLGNSEIGLPQRGSRISVIGSLDQLVPAEVDFNTTHLQIGWTYRLDGLWRFGAAVGPRKNGYNLWPLESLRNRPQWLLMCITIRRDITWDNPYNYG